MTATPNAALAAIADLGDELQALVGLVDDEGPEAAKPNAEALAKRIDALGFDKLGQALDDPAWHDVVDAMRRFQARLAELSDGVEPEETDGDLPEAKGRGRRRGLDPADAILNGFYGGLYLAGRAMWWTLKTSVRLSIAAGKLAAPHVARGADAIGRAGYRVAERIHDRVSSDGNVREYTRRDGTRVHSYTRGKSSMTGLRNAVFGASDRERAAHHARQQRVHETAAEDADHAARSLRGHGGFKERLDARDMERRAREHRQRAAEHGKLAAGARGPGDVSAYTRADGTEVRSYSRGKDADLDLEAKGDDDEMSDEDMARHNAQLGRMEDMRRALDLIVQQMAKGELDDASRRFALEILDQIEAELGGEKSMRGTETKKVLDLPDEDGNTIMTDVRDDDYSYELAAVIRGLKAQFDDVLERERGSVDSFIRRNASIAEAPRVRALIFDIINQVQDDLRAVFARLDASQGKSAPRLARKSRPQLALPAPGPRAHDLYR